MYMQDKLNENLIQCTYLLCEHQYYIYDPTKNV